MRTALPLSRRRSTSAADWTLDSTPTGRTTHAAATARVEGGAAQRAADVQGIPGGEGGDYFYSYYYYYYYYYYVYVYVYYVYYYILHTTAAAAAATTTTTTTTTT